MVRPGAAVGEVTVEGGVVSGLPLGGVPVAVAAFTTLPAVTSAGVTTCVAGQVVVAPTASVPGSAIGAQAPSTAFGSLTVTVVIATLPVLVTTMS